MKPLGLEFELLRTDLQIIRKDGLVNNVTIWYDYPNIKVESNHPLTEKESEWIHSRFDYADSDND